MKLKTITLGELRADLAWTASLSDDTLITFGAGNLSYLRAKTRLYRDGTDTPEIINIEFGEQYTVTHDPDSET